MFELRYGSFGAVLTALLLATHPARAIKPCPDKPECTLKHADEALCFQEPECRARAKWIAVGEVRKVRVREQPAGGTVLRFAEYDLLVERWEAGASPQLTTVKLTEHWCGPRLATLASPTPAVRVYGREELGQGAERTTALYLEELAAPLQRCEPPAPTADKQVEAAAVTPSPEPAPTAEDHVGGVPTQKSEPSAPPPNTPSSHACGCRVVGQSQSSGLGLLALALTALSARRPWLSRGRRLFCPRFGRSRSQK